MSDTPVLSSRVPTASPTIFGVRNLSVLAYAQGFTHWHYRGGSLALVRRNEWWKPVADMLEPGDVIWCSMADGFAELFVQSATEKDGVVMLLIKAINAGAAP